MGLPNAVTSQLGELVVNKITLSCLPITPTALEFKSTGSAPLLSDVTALNGEVLSRSGANTLSAGYDDGMDAQIIKGSEAIIVNCSNLPLSKTCLNIKIVMHLEGIKSLATSTLLVPPMEKPVQIPPISFEKILTKVVNSDSIKLLPSYIGEGVRGYAGGGPLGALTAVFNKLGI